MGSRVHGKNAAGRLVAIGIAAVFSLGCDPAGRETDRSDLNHDGIVDLEDLKIYAELRGLDWESADWCEWTGRESTDEALFTALFEFTREHYSCDAPEPREDPLAIVNQNRYPTRLAWGPLGKLYVSDAKVGSVFIYTHDAEAASLELAGELKGVGRPLAVGVDSAGQIYVGNDARDQVEVYSPAGVLVRTIDPGNLEMPNDLAFSRLETLYVVDSLAHRIRVFDRQGVSLKTIGAGELDFPAAVTVVSSDDGTGQEVGELFVADQGHYTVKVFDLEGTYLRSIGRKVSFSWEGRFVKVQSLFVDGAGRLHVTDSYVNRIQILDVRDGRFLGAYGTPGSEAGQLLLPLDIARSSQGQVVVANSENQRIELFASTP